MYRLASIVVLMLLVTGCGSVTPGDDSDPIGAYRFSHGRIHGQLLIRELPGLSSCPA